MLENGVYRARPVAAVLGQTSEGKPQVVVEFEVLDRDGVAGTERISWYGYFTEKSTDITLRALRTMGWTGDDVSNLSMLEGEVSIVVEQETYESKTRAKVKWVNKPGASAAALPEDAAKAFAASLRAQVRAFDAKEGKPKVNGAPKPTSRQGALPPEPPPHTEDDSLPNF